MPEKARVFVAEDNQNWFAKINKTLVDFGHSVVAHASNLDEGLTLIEQFGKLRVQVAVLDGRLREVDPEEEDFIGNYEGLRLAHGIYRIDRRIIRIGMSEVPLPFVDIDLGKSKLPQLGDIVRRL